MSHKYQIPHNDNIHSPAVRPHFWALITDLTLPSPPGPSTPPEELQLTTLDSSSVLVSWHPPLEPNGIIISYWILYSGNLSEPEHLWKNVSQDGGCFFSRHINSIKCIFYFYIYSNICSLYERTHYFAFFKICFLSHREYYQCRGPGIGQWH